MTTRQSPTAWSAGWRSASGSRRDGLGITVNTIIATEILDNIRSNNDGDGSGISAGIQAVNVRGARIENNTCTENTLTTANTFGIRVVTAGRRTVIGNRVANNGSVGAGISCSSAAIYRAANLVSSTDGIVDGTGGAAPGGADTTH